MQIVIRQVQASLLTSDKPMATNIVDFLKRDWNQPECTCPSTTMRASQMEPLHSGALYLGSEHPVQIGATITCHAPLVVSLATFSSEDTNGLIQQVSYIAPMPDS